MAVVTKRRLHGRRRRLAGTGQRRRQAELGGMEVALGRLEQKLDAPLLIAVTCVGATSKHTAEGLGKPGRGASGGSGGGRSSGAGFFGLGVVVVGSSGVAAVVVVVVIVVVVFGGSDFGVFGGTIVLVSVIDRGADFRAIVVLVSSTGRIAVFVVDIGYVLHRLGGCKNVREGGSRRRDYNSGRFLIAVSVVVGEGEDGQMVCGMLHVKMRATNAHWANSCLTVTHARTTRGAPISSACAAAAVQLSLPPSARAHQAVPGMGATAVSGASSVTPSCRTRIITATTTRNRHCHILRTASWDCIRLG